jgi:hypothetical protein
LKSGIARSELTRARGHERPGKAVCLGIKQNLSKPVYEGIPIHIVLKDFLPFYSTDDEMMQSAGSADASFSWHDSLYHKFFVHMSSNKGIPVPLSLLVFLI